MAGNRVQIDLIAKDLITPVLGKIKAGFGSLGSFSRTAASSMGALGSTTKNTTDAFEGLGKKASTILQGITLGLSIQAVNALTSAVDRLKDAFGEAMELNTRAIGSINSLAAVSGLPFQKAKELVEQMNIQMANLAKDLPGEAQDFINTANMIAPAFSDAFGRVTQGNMETFKNKLVDISKIYTLLGQQSGVISPESTGEFVRRFISGSSTFGELRMLDFGTKNPAFMKMVKAELEKLGLDSKDFQKLTENQRLKILEDVGNKLLDPEAIKALQDSSAGMLASIKDQLFSPLIGTFGLLRKVAAQGNRSVDDAITGFLKTFTQVSNTWGQLTQRLGLTFDPMSTLIQGVDWVNDLLVSFNNQIKRVIGDTKVSDFKGLSLQERISKLFNLGNVKVDLLTPAKAWLDSITDKLLAIDVYSALSSVGNAIGESYYKFLFSFDWGSLGKAAGTLTGTLIGALVRAVFDWRTYRNIILGALGMFTAGIRTLVGVIQGLISSLISELTKGLGSYIKNIPDRVKLFVDTFNGFMDTAVRWVQGLISRVTGVFTGGNQENKNQRQSFLNWNPLELFTVKPKNTTQPPTPAKQPLTQPKVATLNNSNQVATTNNYQVSVQATTGASPEEIAKTVMATISGQYTSYKQNMLTA